MSEASSLFSLGSRKVDTTIYDHNSWPLWSVTGVTEKPGRTHRPSDHHDKTRRQAGLEEGREPNTAWSFHLLDYSIMSSSSKTATALADTPSGSVLDLFSLKGQVALITGGSRGACPPSVSRKTRLMRVNRDRSQHRHCFRRSWSGCSACAEGHDEYRFEGQDPFSGTKMRDHPL